MFSTTWKALSTAATIYVIVQKLKALNSMRMDIYDDLSPEMKEQYVRFFGDPKLVVPDPFTALYGQAAQYIPDSWERYVEEVLVVSPQSGTQILQIEAGS